MEDIREQSPTKNTYKFLGYTVNSEIFARIFSRIALKYIFDALKIRE